MSARTAGWGRWWNRAACLDADTRLFFPRPQEARKIAAAKAFCARCPVVAGCLADAEKTGDTHAVRGGMTGPERHEARPSDAWCKPGLHERTPENTTAAGQCRECKRENYRKHQPPTGRGRGNSAAPRERDGNGQFASPHRGRRGLAA